MDYSWLYFNIKPYTRTTYLKCIQNSKSKTFKYTQMMLGWMRKMFWLKIFVVFDFEFFLKIKTFTRKTYLNWVEKIEAKLSNALKWSLDGNALQLKPINTF